MMNAGELSNITGSLVLRSLLLVAALVPILGWSSRASAEPLSEPELTMVCRPELGKPRWLQDMKSAADRQAINQIASPKLWSCYDEAVTVNDGKEKKEVRKLAANLAVVCDALSSRTKVDQEALRHVASCYREWASSSAPQGAEQNTIFNVTQARDQVVLGLSRSGSSRGQTQPMGTTLVQESRDRPSKHASDELTLFMIKVLNDRLCGGGGKDIFENVCRALEGSETLPASAAALSRASRADLRRLPIWMARYLMSADPRVADEELGCLVDVSNAFVSAARAGQPVFDTVSDAQVIKDLMVFPERCGARIDKLATLLRAVRASRKYASFGALRDEGSYGLLVSLATVELPILKDDATTIEQTVEVLRRIDLLADTIESARIPSAQDRQVSTATLAVLRPLLKRITNRAHADDIEPLVNAMQATLREDYPDAYVQLLAVAKIQTVLNHLGTSARRGLGIVAEMAAANTSADVAVVLEQSALPLGAWRRKDERQWGLTLSGLLGLHINYEWVTQDVVVEGRQLSVASGTVIGPAAILGVDVHRGFGGCRWGALVSLLDFGAITSTRLHAGSGADLTPDKGARVGIQQLLAPGAYTYLGVGPVGFGGGISWVPSLRPTTVNAQAQELSVLRLGAFAAIDIPIVPLL